MSLRSYSLLSALAQQEHFPSQTSTSMEVNRRSITSPHESHLPESISVPIRHTRPYNHNRHGTWIISRCSGGNPVYTLPSCNLSSQSSFLSCTSKAFSGFMAHQKFPWFIHSAIGSHLLVSTVDRLIPMEGRTFGGCMDGAKWSVFGWNVTMLECSEPGYVDGCYPLWLGRSKAAHRLIEACVLH